MTCYDFILAACESKEFITEWQQLPNVGKQKNIEKIRVYNLLCQGAMTPVVRTYFF